MTPSARDIVPINHKTMRIALLRTMRSLDVFAVNISSFKGIYNRSLAPFWIRNSSIIDTTATAQV